jgi:hypothetical protein
LAYDKFQLSLSTISTKRSFCCSAWPSTVWETTRHGTRGTTEFEAIVAIDSQIDLQMSGYEMGEIDVALLAGDDDEEEPPPSDREASARTTSGDDRGNHRFSKAKELNEGRLRGR